MVGYINIIKECYSMLTSIFKGVYTDDGCSDDKFLFITERLCQNVLMKVMMTK